MNERPNKRGYLLIFIVLVNAFLILVYAFGSSVVYISFPILLVAIVACFCHARSTEVNEQNQEMPSQNLQEEPVQNLPTTTHIYNEKNSDNFCPRPSIGRILMPVDDEKTGTNVESRQINSSNSSSSAISEAEQKGLRHQLILSADFGDSEILAVEESACAICLVDYHHGEKIQRNGFQNVAEGGATCDHIFHPNCISTWIKSSGDAKCPCCRRSFWLETLPV